MFSERFGMDVLEVKIVSAGFEVISKLKYQPISPDDVIINGKRMMRSPAGMRTLMGWQIYPFYVNWKDGVGYPKTEYEVRIKDREYLLRDLDKGTQTKIDNIEMFEKVESK